MGENAKAVKAWNEGLKIDPENRDLQNRIEKFK